MAVIAVTELATITTTRRFGEPPKSQRKWVVEVNDPTTSESEMALATGTAFLDPHPEHGYLLAFNVSLTNYSGSRWHYEVTWDYELPKQSSDQRSPNPLGRADIWRWSTGGLQVPALYYYDNVNTIQALVNSANDYFEGATTEISTLQAVISGNRPTFDYGLATTITNAVNGDSFLNSAQYTWKCAGISAQPAVEVVNEAEVRYWQVEVTLEYRPDGWPLLLPDVGFNYLEGSVKKRAYVIDSETGDKVPASNPQPLNTDGTLKTGAPNILTRRVHQAIDFSSYFGTPTQP